MTIRDIRPARVQASVVKRHGWPAMATLSASLYLSPSCSGDTLKIFGCSGDTLKILNCSGDTLKIFGCSGDTPKILDQIRDKLLFCQDWSMTISYFECIGDTYLDI